MELFDTHSHVGMLKHLTPEQAMERAAQEGVTRLVSVSTQKEDWETNAKMAHTFSHVWYSLGVHPHETETYSKVRDELWHHFEKGVPSGCVAIGEMGLDYYYEHSSPQAQKEAFVDQLRLAKKVGLPLIVHCREAFGDVYDLIEKEGGMGEKGGVLHCFTGSLENATRGIALGFKVSFSGIVTFKKALELQEVAKALGDDALLIETDCPYLAPVPKRGQPNEPGFLPHTARFLAELRGQSLEAFAQTTTKNAIDFFGVK